MWKFSRSENGQIFLWLALGIPLLILMSALALDMGMIYRTKARLGNAVDSAVLTGAKYYALGESNGKWTSTVPQGLANDMFVSNYGTACGSGGVTCTWTWCPSDASCPAGSAITATLTARVPWQTTFMAYLPQWATWTVGDAGQATRSTLVMTLILDRSGSMSSNNGGTALQAAVPLFVGDFTEGTDYLGMVSFASHSSIDVAVEKTGFTSAIDNAVKNMTFVGGTFGTGAGSGSVYSNTNGPPLSLADAQNKSVNLGAGVPEVKVVVYFTDGLMNTIQDQFICSGTTYTLNYGGYDQSQCGRGDPCELVATLDPLSEDNGNTWGCYDASNTDCQNTGFQYDSGGDYCRNPGYVKTFTSELNGAGTTITRAHVTSEAQYRAIITANTMRQETIQTYVFVIGLGHDISGTLSTEQFLNTLANDPGGPAAYGCGQGPYQSPYTNCYDPNLTQGLFVVVPDCPGSACTAELEQAFNLIASKILLRLSQ